MNISHPASSIPRVTRIPPSSHSSHMQFNIKVIDFYLQAFSDPHAFICIHNHPTELNHYHLSLGLYNSISPPSPMVQPGCLLPSALGNRPTFSSVATEAGQPQLKLTILSQMPPLSITLYAAPLVPPATNITVVLLQGCMII